MLIVKFKYNWNHEGEEEERYLYDFISSMIKYSKLEEKIKLAEKLLAILFTDYLERHPNNREEMLKNLLSLSDYNILTVEEENNDAYDSTIL